jgi:hypothetical protein
VRRPRPGECLALRQASAERPAPTMKPMALVKRAIGNSSKPRDTVPNPFGGSGTTTVVAEQAGQRAALLELDPCYADVMVRRRQEAAGAAVVLEGKDQASDDISAWGRRPVHGLSGTRCPSVEPKPAHRGGSQGQIPPIGTP